MKYVTYVIIIILILVFITINNYDTKNEPMNYVTRSFYHADLNHLLLNLFSFYNLSFIEEVIGMKQFIIAIVFITVVSSLLLYIYHLIFPSRKVYTVGFSGVIFGLIVIYYAFMKVGKGATALHLILGIIPQIFMVGISWEGHICGIIAGLLYITLFPVKPLIN